jgi:hypothetical protein
MDGAMVGEQLRIRRGPEMGRRLLPRTSGVRMFAHPYSYYTTWTIVVRRTDQLAR